MDYSLSIDARETGLINILKESEHTIKTQNLDIGDIHIIRGDNLVACIERKTVSDLAASIKDGRYREQKLRLKAANCAVRGYIIENTLPVWGDVNGIAESTLRSALVNTVTRDKMMVLQSTSTYETSLWVLKLLEKCNEQRWDEMELESSPSSSREYTDTLSTVKKRNMTPETCFVTQLKVLPGVSSSIAESIVSEFCSFKDLFDKLGTSSDEERIEVLSKLTTGEKRRKIGTKVAVTVNTYLFM